jgi:glycosyltransferase involved in cell wall biosynthesis
MAGGVERVLSLKANFFADVLGYDVTIILTEGKKYPLFYPLSDKVKIINLDIGFEELWNCSFVKKIIVYIKKQLLFRKKLTAELKLLRPDITVSLLRREINFITDVKDGSKKIGELHVNRTNYRNFEANDANFIKRLFARFWMSNLVGHLRKLDKFVVLTEEDKRQWIELNNVISIPDPLTFFPEQVSSLEKKRVIAVGRYVYQKGFDLLLKVWSMVENRYPDWELVVFGTGDREPYESIKKELNIDDNRCHLNGPSINIQQEYINSSIFAFTSRFEGFGMVLVEAMACGLPVISFDCPCGPRDIIADNEDGFLVHNGNINEYVRELTLLMDDASLRLKMSVAGRKNVERFKMENIGMIWKKLFDGLYE